MTKRSRLENHYDIIPVLEPIEGTDGSDAV